jgi:hypothetical protein
MASYGAVIISRNDNYGGNLVERASYCLNSCIITFDEIFYIDWNSPEKCLIEEIEPNLLKTGKLKWIQVTPEEHKLFTNNDESVQVCCEVLGRNIGVRRLSTDFIVSTNIDEISPPRPQLETLTSKTTFYTIARHGIQDMNILRGAGNYQEIDKIRGILLGMGLPQAWPVKMSLEDDWSLVGWCGDFQVAHRNVWYKIRGFEEVMLGRGLADTFIQRKAKEEGFELKLVYDVPIWHMDHGAGSGGIGRNNNPETWIYKDYKGTTNSEDWGKPNYPFEVHTL